MTHNAREIEELDQLILAHIAVQSGFHAGNNTVGDVDKAGERIKDFFHQELQKAQAEVKYEVIKLLAGNTPIYEKRKASAYNEGVTSGWYAAREFIRLELNAQQIQSELDHFNK